MQHTRGPIRFLSWSPKSTFLHMMWVAFLLHCSTGFLFLSLIGRKAPHMLCNWCKVMRSVRNTELGNFPILNLVDQGLYLHFGWWSAVNTVTGLLPVLKGKQRMFWGKRAYVRIFWVWAGLTAAACFKFLPSKLWPMEQHACVLPKLLKRLRSSDYVLLNQDLYLAILSGDLYSHQTLKPWFFFKSYDSMNSTSCFQLQWLFFFWLNLLLPGKKPVKCFLRIHFTPGGGGEHL